MFCRCGIFCFSIQTPSNLEEWTWFLAWRSCFNSVFQLLEKYKINYFLCNFINKLPFYFQDYSTEGMSESLLVFLQHLREFGLVYQRKVILPSIVFYKNTLNLFFRGKPADFTQQDQPLILHQERDVLYETPQILDTSLLKRTIGCMPILKIISKQHLQEFSQTFC